MFNGAGVFDGKTNQLVDVISGLEIVAVNLITGDLKGGYIEFESNDGEMVYEIKRAKSNIEMNIDETGKLNIDIEIDTEGNIAEVFSDNSLLSKEYFNELDKLISERMEKITSNIIKKAQEDIGMDFFGFREMMEERHYKEWLKAKDNWDEGENIFQNASINVTVDATVRATGTMDQTRD